MGVQRSWGNLALLRRPEAEKKRLFLWCELLVLWMTEDLCQRGVLQKKTVSRVGEDHTYNLPSLLDQYQTRTPVLVGKIMADPSHPEKLATTQCCLQKLFCFFFGTFTLACIAKVFRCSSDPLIHVGPHISFTQQRRTHCKERRVFAVRVKAFLFTRGDLLCSSICQLEVPDSETHTVTLQTRTVKWQHADEHASQIGRKFSENQLPHPTPGIILTGQHFQTHSLNFGEQTIAMASGSIIW